MAKIIEATKAHPIKCVCCGSVYEFEVGDRVDVVEATIGYDTTIVNKLLECPNCGYSNTIKFIEEN